MYRWLWLICLIPLAAQAEDDARPAESDVQSAKSHPSLMLEWDNARPEQKQALEQFYRSLERPLPPESGRQRMEREQHFERLREMTPEQRQEQFRDFVQQPPPRPSIMTPPPSLMAPPPPPPGMMPLPR